MTAYYNEHDPKAAAWLRELIKQGHIAPGVVDERSIEDVKPAELEGYTQCHFFAGIGVWSYALRRAGWPDDKPVWTGSCPCQPFSAAGKGDGFIDERHLWPAWYHLITQCEPSRIFGEQVASKDGLGWLDLVQADLEGAGYTNGAIDLCAAGVGAPHIRQRLWLVAERVADPDGVRLPGFGGCSSAQSIGAAELRKVGGLGDTEHDGRPASAVSGSHAANVRDTPQGADSTLQPTGTSTPLPVPGRCAGNAPGPTNGFWESVDWLYCRDGKFRPVRPGTSPLADGAPERVGRLRGYGNAINAEVATTFIEAYLSIDAAAS